MGVRKSLCREFALQGLNFGRAGRAGPVGLSGVRGPPEIVVRVLLLSLV